MSTKRSLGLVLFLLAATACGKKGSLRVNTSDLSGDAVANAKKKAKAAAEDAAKKAVGLDADDDADEEDDDDDAPKKGRSKKLAMPTACAKGSEAGTCLVDAAFVSKVCEADEPMPAAALALFAKGTPWTRAYTSRAVESLVVDADGERKSQLAAQEEVVVLRRPKGKGSAAASYQVLRWSGECVTLGADDVSTKKVASPKRATIAWASLPNETQEALAADARIAKAQKARQEACRGVSTSAPPPPPCAKAEQALSAKIVEHALGGGKLPKLDFVSE